MAKKKTDSGITEVARTIGSTLGNAVVQASRVVEGVKAAAKAGAETYSKKTSKPRGRRAAAKPAKKRGARKDKVFCGYGWDLRARASQKRERGRTRSRCTSRGATKKTTSRFDEETTIWLDSSRPES